MTNNPAAVATNPMIMGSRWPVRRKASTASPAMEIIPMARAESSEPAAKAWRPYRCSAYNGTSVAKPRMAAP